MNRLAWLMLAALALAGCSERPQQMAGQQIGGSVPSWQGPQTAFTAPGWKVGDRDSWMQQMQRRAQGQNEFVRMASGG